jgi:hypothetical protein
MRRFDSVDLGVDRLTKARRLEHYLSPSSPIHVKAHVYDSPTILKVEQHDGIY